MRHAGGQGRRVCEAGRAAVRVAEAGRMGKGAGAAVKLVLRRAAGAGQGLWRVVAECVGVKG